jgi:hypothetical protein
LTKPADINCLRKTLEGKIAEGKTLCVLGWKPSNHNRHTKSLADSKRVQFIDRSGRDKLKSLPENTVVIMTEFISHSDVKALKSRSIPHHPHPISIGKIRDILLYLTMCLIAEVNTKQRPVSKTVKPHTESGLAPDLEELEARVISGGRSADKYDRLANFFAEQTDSLVGTHTMQKKLHELGFKENKRALAQSGWIVGVTLPGKKNVSRYKAGPELEKRLQQIETVEPSDSLDRALWLLKQESVARQKLADLKILTEYWETQLRRINAAKELIRQIERV